MCKSSYPAQIEAPFKTVEVVKTSNFSIDTLCDILPQAWNSRERLALSRLIGGFEWSVVWELGLRSRRKCATRV
jgi:hypothetical protein